MASYDGRGYNNFGIIESYGGREKAVDPARLSPRGNEYTTETEDYPLPLEPQEEGVDTSTPTFSRNKVSLHDYSNRDNTPPSRDHHHGKYYNPGSCSSDDDDDGENKDHEGHHKASAFGEAPRDDYASLRKIGMEGFDIIDELYCTRATRYDDNPCAVPGTRYGHGKPCAVPTRYGHGKPRDVVRTRYDDNPCAGYDDNPCAAPHGRYDNPGSLVQEKDKIEIPSVTTYVRSGTPLTRHDQSLVQEKDRIKKKRFRSLFKWCRK